MKCGSTAIEIDFPLPLRMKTKMSGKLICPKCGETAYIGGE